jgi:hypothetical protein
MECGLRSRTQRCAQSRLSGLHRRPYHLPTQSDDPREAIGRPLFEALKASQDVRGVDMGHVLIGMNARASSVAREDSVLPGVSGGPTGLEAVTWVGDLGGAAARVALDRVHNAAAGVDRYFRGNDYGAPSNLEGDVSAHVAGAAALPATAAPELSLPASGLIADALAAHFLRPHGRDDGKYQFVRMLGGRFAGNLLGDRADVAATMATKLALFAPCT